MPDRVNDALPLHIGFVGFGEVASTFAVPMVERGAQVSAYDILLEGSGGRDILAKRARVEGIQFCPLPEMVRNADYVLSTAATHVALDIARGCAAYLRPGQTFIDLNSTAPAVKAEIGEIVAPSGAAFVEGAILGAVGASGAGTRILVGGEQGQGAAEALCGLGLNVSFYGPEIGKASTFKMLRSIFSKGLEALTIEFLIAGRRAGIEDDLWNEVTGLLERTPFERVAANWVQTHAVAYERRYHEMVQVAATMRELGVEPVMTAATEAFFERSFALGLDDAFPEKPDAMARVIDFMISRLIEKE